MTAVDTSVFLYAHDDPRDIRKQAIALSLLSSLNDGVLLWQVACEFLAAGRGAFRPCPSASEAGNRSTPPRVDVFPARLGRFH